MDVERNLYMKEYNKKYLKTKKGFIQRLYTKMKSRVKGTHGHNEKYYKGKGILDKQKFYTWLETNPTFHVLFREWTLSEFDRLKVPTIDRLNSNLGYLEGNIEVVTFSENMRRSNMNGYNRKKTQEA